MAKLLDYNATVTGRLDLEPSLAIFRVRPDAVPLASSDPWFVPGQYMTIGMNCPPTSPDDPEVVPVRRPMSVASAPEERDEVEFYIRRVSTPSSTRPLTHAMWPIRVGDRLHVRPIATGKFTLADTVGEGDGRLKVLVAAGTGLAPFISMVRSRILRDPAARLDDLAILHGASFPTGLGYRAELEGYAARHGLLYLPTVSRPQMAEGWAGRAGRVESLFEPENLEATEVALGLGAGGLTPARATVLICGLQGTIANTVTALLGRGFVPENRRLRRALDIDPAVAPAVFWEQYDTTPVIDVKDAAVVEALQARYRQAVGHG